jgi:hypothetical protein
MWRRQGLECNVRYPRDRRQKLPFRNPPLAAVPPLATKNGVRPLDALFFITTLSISADAAFACSAPPDPKAVLRSYSNQIELGRVTKVKAEYAAGIVTKNIGRVEPEGNQFRVGLSQYYLALCYGSPKLKVGDFVAIYHGNAMALGQFALAWAPVFEASQNDPRIARRPTS